MKYSREQQTASLLNPLLGENRYVINKREKGQKRFFTCSCCGIKHDFKDSVDYVGAVEQWERFGGKCYACANGYCHCKETGKIWG